MILDKAHWAFRQSAVDMGEGELGRDTYKSPYQSSHDLMLFSSNQQVYKNYMGSLGGDIINSLYSLGSNIFTPKIFGSGPEIKKWTVSKEITGRS